MKHPIDRIEWRQAESLNANNWNPNVVMDAELRLLEASIVKTGWLQPILVTVDGTIIDGFHRWRLALESVPLRKRDGGLVPCAVMDISPEEAKMLTVRINRAKGSHVAVRMSDLVKSLTTEHGCSREEIAAGIGATLDEVDLLEQDSIFKARNLKDYRYSKAWVPEETTGR